jgi:hypothetical protein
MTDITRSNSLTDLAARDRAFKLVSWFYDLSAHWRSVLEQLDKDCETAGVAPARP